MTDKVKRTLATIASMTDAERIELQTELDRLKKEPETLKKSLILGQWTKTASAEPWISSGPGAGRCPHCGR